MNGFDIVYAETGNGDFLCYAPFHALKVGDTVELQNGRAATVKDLVYTFAGDDIFQFLKRNMKMQPVKAVVHQLNYDEVTNYDIST